MANDGIEVQIDGNQTGFKRAMQEVLQSSKDAANGIESSFAPLKNVFAGVHASIAAIGAVLAASTMFRAGIEETKKLTGEANALARQMGMTATQASILNVALGDSYTTAEDYGSAAQMLTRQIRTNEEAVNAMGLKTRDASGHYRNMQDVMRDAGKVLEEYKEGMDRTAAAQVLFGKGAGDGAAIIRASKADMAEAEEKARALGLVVGVENVEAYKQYKAAINDAGDVMSALKKAIGDAVMPVLTEMSNWFASIGPAAVTVTKGAFGGLISTFHLVTMGVTVLWETLNAMVVTVTEPIRALAVAISKAISGDWSGAASEIKNVGQVMSGAWGQAFDEMAVKARKTREQIYNLFANPTDAAAKSVGGKNYTPPKESKEKVKKEESLMPYYEAALEGEKRLAYERDALRGYTKQQELAFWQTLITNVNLTGKDRLAIERKISGLIIDIKRTEAKQRQELDSEGIRSGEALALGRLEAERAAAQTALELNQMTKAQFLVLEENFEQKRFEIQQAALVERMKLMEKDPNFNVVEYVRLKNQMLEAEQQHNIKRMQIQGQAAVESNQIWKSLGDRMGTLWDQGMQAMLNGMLTWRSSMRAIGASIVGWFATDVVGKQVKTWLLGETAKTGATQTGTAMRLAVEAGAALKSVGIWAAAAIKNIMTSAWEAMAGAYKAIAGIQYVGPVLAPVVAAGAFAGVASLAKNVMSAEGGYDIPRGLNPMVQLHEQEMVLPKQHANVIRGLAEGGSVGGGVSGGISVHVTAMDSKDVMRALKDGGVLHKAIKDLHRSFAR